MRLSSTLIGLGLLLLGYAGLSQVGLAPGSRLTLPTPVAVQRVRDEPLAQVSLESPAPVAPTPQPTVVRAPRPTAQSGALPVLVLPTPPVQAAPVATPVPRTAPYVPADAVDRTEYAKLPPPGYAVRMAIPAIKLDSIVKQGGIIEDNYGTLAWQTLPFVAVHYGDTTALVGARGNAVIAGHVVTINEGNVFRYLYKINLGDTIQVWDDHDREHYFHVVDVTLVPPTDVSPMATTPDPTLTLITCSGTFDPVKREFSARLIVVAKPDY